MEYPVDIDFKSQPVCEAAAKNLDKVQGAEVAVYLKCHDGKMTGFIDANPNLRSAPLKLVWPSSVAASCSQVMSHLNSSAQCKQLGLSMADTLMAVFFDTASGQSWISTFDFPLVNGKPVEEVQASALGSGSMPEHSQ